MLVNCELKKQAPASKKERKKQAPSTADNLLGLSLNTSDQLNIICKRYSHKPLRILRLQKTICVLDENKAFAVTNRKNTFSSNLMRYIIIIKTMVQFIL